MNVLSQSNFRKPAFSQLFTVALLGALCIFANNAYAAKVKKMVRQASAQDIDGETYIAVDVYCSGKSEKRVIIRKSDNRLWCAQLLPENCSRNQVTIASDVCSNKFEEKVAAYNKQQNDSVNLADAPAPKIDNKTEITTDQSATEQPAAVSQAEPKPEVNPLEVELQRIRAKQQKIELQLQELEAKKRKLLAEK